MLERINLMTFHNKSHDQFWRFLFSRRAPQSRQTNCAQRHQRRGKLYNAYGLTMDPTNCARACIGRGNQPMRRARCLAGSKTFCATLFTKELCEELKCAPKQRMSSTHFNCSPSTCNCLASALACNEVPQHLLFPHLNVALSSARNL